jgi:hypothetical protein
MDTEVRRKLDMAARVREFTRARAATEPGYVPVLDQLDQLLTRADAILARQYQGRVAATGARAHRIELRRMLHAQLVHYLVAVGALASRDRADVAARFKLPSTNATNAAFVTAVESLLAAGTEQKDLLVQAGMSPTLLDELQKMLDEFQTASEAARTARREHIGARADLAVITAALVEQVGLVDGLTRYRFGNDPEMMAEWRAARQRLGAPRPPAPPSTPPAPAPQPPAGEVKEAA